MKLIGTDDLHHRLLTMIWAGIVWESFPHEEDDGGIDPESWRGFNHLKMRDVHLKSGGLLFFTPADHGIFGGAAD